TKHDEVNRVFGSYFGNDAPARVVLGVARLPEPAIEINAVAVRSLTDKRAVYPADWKWEESASPGVLTHDRLFVSGMFVSNAQTGKVPDDAGSQVDLALDRMQAVLKSAGLELSHMVF